VELADRARESTTSIACDTIVFTGDWIPDHELARAAGLALDAGTRGPQVDAAFRTSAPGVFAAGNLLHGAETAGTAALEGRAAAASIARFLDGAEEGRTWRTATAVPVQAVPPLSFVVPGALVPGEAPPFAFVARAAAFLGREAFEVRQDGRLLHRAGFRTLVPHRSLRLASHWVSAVRPDGGPVVVSALARSQGAP
jgi:hypothetical protein